MFPGSQVRTIFVVVIISVSHIVKYLICLKCKSQMNTDEGKFGKQRFSIGIWPFITINGTFLLIIFLIEEGFIFLQTKI